MYVTQPVAFSQLTALPPSPRDFEAYRLVKIEQRTTRDAARELHLSQTRVCQLVSRVAEFLVETAPAADDGVQRKKQLHVAEQVAAERLDHLQKEAMAGFQRSRESSKVPGKGKSTAAAGDPRFLYLSARLALLAAKLPLPTLSDVMFAADHDRDDRSDSAIPPEEDCSTLAARLPERAPQLGTRKAATPLPAESSIGGVSVGLPQKLNETQTVQRGSGSRGRDDRRAKQERRAAFLSGA